MGKILQLKGRKGSLKWIQHILMTVRMRCLKCGHNFLGEIYDDYPECETHRAGQGRVLADNAANCGTMLTSGSALTWMTG